MRQIKVGDRVYLGSGLPLYRPHTSPRTEWIVCKVEGDFLHVTRAYFGHGQVIKVPVGDFAYVIEPENIGGAEIELGKNYDGWIAVAYGHFNDQVLCLRAEDNTLFHLSVEELNGRL